MSKVAVLYENYQEMIQEIKADLGAEAALALVEAIMAYSFDSASKEEILASVPISIKYVVKSYLDNIDMMDEKRSKAKEGGKKGGRPKKDTSDEKPEVSNENLGFQEKTLGFEEKPTLSDENLGFEEETRVLDENLNININKNKNININKNVNNKTLCASDDALDTGDKKPSPPKQPKKPTKKDFESHFEELWLGYPEKRGKSAVSNKTKRELFDIPTEAMLEAISTYRGECQKTGYAYVNGSTWFNGRYKDYLPENYTPSAQAMRADSVNNKQPSWKYVSGEGYRDFGLMEE